jgi:peptidoglycan/xylan/chitin deacetylase (PgdA/CDA1 family)
VTLEQVPPVLMYHSVTPDRGDGSPWAVHVERFDQQMAWLRRRGFRGASMRELLGSWPGAPGPRLVGLTFDDGYADFAEWALPVLRRHGFSATAFVVAGQLGGENIWAGEARKALLTADQVRMVAEAGFEVGSHGWRHTSLPSASDADLAEEVECSRGVLQEASGQEVTGFCYPFGHHDARVLSSARAAGYDYVCAVGYSQFTGRFALPRIYVGNGDSPARLWAKAMRYWLRWEYDGPAAGALAAVSARRAGLAP